MSKDIAELLKSLEVAYPDDPKPFIKWKHIDGPVLVCRDGQMYWLTWGERFKLWIGVLTIELLEAKVLKLSAKYRFSSLDTMSATHRRQPPPSAEDEPHG